MTPTVNRHGSVSETRICYVDNNYCKCFNVRFYITGPPCVQHVHILAMMVITSRIVVCVNGRQQLRLRCSTADKCVLRDERWATQLQLNGKVNTIIGICACSIVAATLIWNMLPSSVRSVENIN